MRSLLLAALALLAVAGTASAQTAPDRHHGFYFHAHLGPAYAAFGSDDVDLHVHGTGGSFDLALGGTITHGVILYAELFDDVAASPSVEFQGQSGSTSSDTSAGIAGFGVGVVHYFMPSNVYVGATLAGARAIVQENGQTRGNSDLGPGLSLKAGKEWLVGSSWGLGVGAQVFVGSMHEHGDSSITYKAFGAALAFSATYH